MAAVLRRVVVTIAASMLGAGVGLGPASADPPSCGAKEDTFACIARTETGPATAGETAFINALRGNVSGSDTDLLVSGRTICSEFRGGDSAQYVDGEVSKHLGMSTHSAEQVVDEATEYACPGVNGG